jgi:5-dehydro-2-deoxygluconokinase
MLLDDKYGRRALFDAEAAGLWVARPLELPGSRPLRFEFSPDVGSRLVEWPVDHTIKVLCFYHPDDPAELKADQIEHLRQAYQAGRKVGREVLIEIIASKHGVLDDATIARALTELYDAGLKPDWWKLEPQASAAAWAAIDRVIETQEQLEQGFRAARTANSVRGFAVGRTIFAEAARSWLAGTMNDEQAIDDMGQRFEALTAIWQRVGGRQ